MVSIFVYASMLFKSLISIKIKTKVVFIVLIKSPTCTNVFYCQCTRQGASFMLSHIGLLSLVVGYCIIGAFIFEVVNCLKTNFPLPGARGGYIILLKYVFLFFNRTYPIDNDTVKTFFWINLEKCLILTAFIHCFFSIYNCMDRWNE